MGFNSLVLETCFNLRLGILPCILHLNSSKKKKIKGSAREMKGGIG